MRNCLIGTLPMKQSPCESGRLALGSQAFRAICLTSDLVKFPIGKRALLS